MSTFLIALVAWLVAFGVDYAIFYFLFDAPQWGALVGAYIVATIVTNEADL